jgi:hypothetical protein
LVALVQLRKATINCNRSVCPSATWRLFYTHEGGRRNVGWVGLRRVLKKTFGPKGTWLERTALQGASCFVPLTNYVSVHGASTCSGAGPPHYRGFTIAFRHNTLGRTPLDGWSARRRDLYLPTHYTHNRETSMPQAGFESTISASEGLLIHSLDRAATRIGTIY